MDARRHPALAADDHPPSPPPPPTPLPHSEMLLPPPLPSPQRDSPPPGVQADVRTPDALVVSAEEPVDERDAGRPEQEAVAVASAVDDVAGQGEGEDGTGASTASQAQPREAVDANELGKTPDKKAAVVSAEASGKGAPGDSEEAGQVEKLATIARGPVGELPGVSSTAPPSPPAAGPETPSDAGLEEVAAKDFLKSTEEEPSTDGRNAYAGPADKDVGTGADKSTADVIAKNNRDAVGGKDGASLEVVEEAPPADKPVPADEIELLARRRESDERKAEEAGKKPEHADERQRREETGHIRESDPQVKPVTTLSTVNKNSALTVVADSDHETGDAAQAEDDPADPDADMKVEMSMDVDSEPELGDVEMHSPVKSARRMHASQELSPVRRRTRSQAAVSPRRLRRRHSEPAPVPRPVDRKTKSKRRLPTKGDRVRILWHVDNIYYEGVIEEVVVFRRKRFFDVIYDSSEREYYVDLSIRKWKYADAREDEDDDDVSDDPELADDEELDVTKWPKRGDDVLIMWHVDGRYYPGRVRDVMRVNRRLFHDITYDRGDEEFFLDLKVRKWRYKADYDGENDANDMHTEAKSARAHTTSRARPKSKPQSRRNATKSTSTATASNASLSPVLNRSRPTVATRASRAREAAVTRPVRNMRKARRSLPARLLSSTSSSSPPPYQTPPSSDSPLSSFAPVGNDRPEPSPVEKFIRDLMDDVEDPSQSETTAQQKRSRGAGINAIAEQLVERQKQQANARVPSGSRPLANLESTVDVLHPELAVKESALRESELLGETELPVTVRPMAESVPTERAVPGLRRPTQLGANTSVADVCSGEPSVEKAPEKSNGTSTEIPPRHPREDQSEKPDNDALPSRGVNQSMRPSGLPNENAEQELAQPPASAIATHAYETSTDVLDRRHAQSPAEGLPISHAQIAQMDIADRSVPGSTGDRTGGLLPGTDAFSVKEVHAAGNSLERTASRPTEEPALRVVGMPPERHGKRFGAMHADPASREVANASDKKRRSKTRVSDIVSVAGLVARKWAAEEFTAMSANIRGLDRQVSTLRKLQGRTEKARRKRQAEIDGEDAEEDLRNTAVPAREPSEQDLDLDEHLGDLKVRTVEMLGRYRGTVEDREKKLKRQFLQVRNLSIVQNSKLMEAAKIMRTLDHEAFKRLEDLEPKLKLNTDPSKGDAAEPNQGMSPSSTAQDPHVKHSAAGGIDKDVVIRNLKRKLAVLTTRTDFLVAEAESLREREKELMKEKEDALPQAGSQKRSSGVLFQLSESLEGTKSPAAGAPPPKATRGRGRPRKSSKSASGKPVGILKKRGTGKDTKLGGTTGRQSGRANRKSLPVSKSKYVPPSSVAKKLGQAAPRPALVRKEAVIATEADILSAASTEKDAKNFPAQLQKQMDRQAAELLALVTSVWLLQDEGRTEPPKQPGENQNRWVEGCIRGALRHALKYLSSCQSIMSARKSLLDDVEGEHMEIHWALSDSGVGIDAARSNYSIWDPTLQDDEWHVERKVLVGLNVSLRKAMELTPAERYSETLRYAQEIARKALADFDVQKAAHPALRVGLGLGTDNSAGGRGTNPATTLGAVDHPPTLQNSQAQSTAKVIPTGSASTSIPLASGLRGQAQRESKSKLQISPLNTGSQAQDAAPRPVPTVRVEGAVASAPTQADSSIPQTPAKLPISSNLNTKLVGDTEGKLSNGNAAGSTEKSLAATSAIGKPRPPPRRRVGRPKGSKNVHTPEPRRTPPVRKLPSNASPSAKPTDAMPSSKAASKTFSEFGAGPPGAPENDSPRLKPTAPNPTESALDVAPTGPSKAADAVKTVEGTATASNGGATGDGEQREEDGQKRFNAVVSVVREKQDGSGTMYGPQEQPRKDAPHQPVEQRDGEERSTGTTTNLQTSDAQRLGTKGAPKKSSQASPSVDPGRVVGPVVAASLIHQRSAAAESGTQQNATSSVPTPSASVVTGKVNLKTAPGSETIPTGSPGTHCDSVPSLPSSELQLTEVSALAGSGTAAAPSVKASESKIRIRSGGPKPQSSKSKGAVRKDSDGRSRVSAIPVDESVEGALTRDSTTSATPKRAARTYLTKRKASATPLSSGPMPVPSASLTNMALPPVPHKVSTPTMRQDPSLPGPSAGNQFYSPNRASSEGMPSRPSASTSFEVLARMEQNPLSPPRSLPFGSDGMEPMMPFSKPPIPNLVQTERNTAIGNSSPSSPAKKRRTNQNNLLQAAAKKKQVGLKSHSGPPRKTGGEGFPPPTDPFDPRASHYMSPFDSASSPRAQGSADIGRHVGTQEYQASMPALQDTYPDRGREAEAPQASMFGGGSEPMYSTYNPNSAPMMNERGADFSQVDLLNPPTPSSFPNLDGYISLNDNSVGLKRLPNDERESLPATPSDFPHDRPLNSALDSPINFDRAPSDAFNRNPFGNPSTAMFQPPTSAPGASGINRLINAQQQQQQHHQQHQQQQQQQQQLQQQQPLQPQQQQQQQSRRDDIYGNPAHYPTPFQPAKNAFQPRGPFPRGPQ